MTTPTDSELSRRAYDTIPSLIFRNFDQWADENAMCQKKLGVWQKYTWRPYIENIRQFSLGLISLGLDRGDILCLIGDNRPEWCWSAFAAQFAGGIAAAIPVNSTATAMKSIVNHCQAKFAVAGNREQVEKFLAVRSELPSLQKVIYWDAKGINNKDNPLLISYSEVLKLGEAAAKNNPHLFQSNIDRVTGDDIAFIYYKIDKNGLPVGVSLTHKALINSGRGLLERLHIKGEDNLISNLPAAKIEDSIYAVMPHLLTGAILNFPEKPETTAHDTREIKPNFAVYSPVQWENTAAEIRAKSNSLFYKLFMPSGYKFADLKMNNKRPNIFRRLFNIPATLLFFRPLRNRFGLRRVRCAAVNGTVASPETFRLLHAAGIELRHTYALPETGLIACQGKEDMAFESVGRPALNTELRITAQGELLVRNTSLFSGYYNDPQQTAAVLVDGWYHTGVTARINENGHLVILQRNSN
jgi:long-chain acyl-CoA synthetase